MKDQKRCPICMAKFDSADELERHNRARHTQQGLSGSSASGDYDDADTERREAGRTDPAAGRRVRPDLPDSDRDRSGW